MGKHRSMSNVATGRAWRLLRLALLWARKGGLLKCRLMSEIRHGAKYIKGLQHNSNKHSSNSKIGMIGYGERQLSFDETPVIHLRMSRPASLRFIKIPCIKPEVVDFDYDFGDCDDVGFESSFMGCNAGSHCGGDICQVDNENVTSTSNQDEDDGIDDKAEEFIAKFYQQIKLQREISFQNRINHNTTNAIEVV